MAYTRDNFPYEQYLRDVQGASDDDIPEGGLTEDQKSRTYQTAIRGFQKEFNAKLSGPNSRRDSIQRTIDEFGGAREVLGVPEPVESARLDINGLVEHFEEIDPNGILGGRTLKDLTSKYSDTFTKGDDAYFRYNQFRGDKNITTDDHKKNIQRQLLEQLEADGSPFTEDTILSEAIGILDKSRRSESLDAEPSFTEPEDIGVLESTGRGAGSGFLDVVGKAVEGISTLGNTLALKSGLGDIRFFDEDSSGEFNLFNYYSAEELEAEFQTRGSLSNDLIGNLGNSIQDIATGINEEADPNSTSNKVGHVAGQLLGFITAGVAGRTTGAVSAAVLSGSEFQLDDYESTLLEKGQEGFNPEEAQNVALLGGVVGSLESLPVFKALGRLSGTTSTPKLLKWLDENSSGGVLKLIKTGTLGAIEEGLQEVVSQVASNLVASDLIEYDPERNLFQGAVEAGETGAAAGGVINTLIGLIAGKRSVSSPGAPPATVDPNTEVEQAIQASQVIESTPFDPPTSVEGAESPTIDEDGNPIPPPPAEIPGTIKPTSTGAVAAVNGQVIVGEDESEVQSKLDDTLSSIIPLGGDVQIDEPAIEQTGDTATVRDADDNAIVTFEGPRPASQIEELIERHNDDSDFKLIKGIKIKDVGDGFIVSLGPHTVRATSIIDGVDAVVRQVEQTGVSSRINLSQIEEEQPSVTIEVEQPKGRKRTTPSGFRAPRFKGMPVRKKGETPDDLALRKLEFAQGKLGPTFNVISVTPTVIKAEKDGLRYEINISKTTTAPNTKRRKGNKGNAFTANVVVTDQQGRLVENPVNQNKPLTSIKGDPLNSSFEVRTPQVGFRIIRETQAGELQPPRLDAANIEAVARRSGGTVTVATADYAQIDYGGENVAITLSDDGAVVHLEDGQVFKVTSEFFNLENGVNSASIITQQLVEAGYEIKSQKGGRTKLVNKEKRELIVKDNGFDATITEGKEEVILEEIVADPISPNLAILFSEEGLSFDVEPIVEEVDRSNTTLVGPFSNNSVNDRVQTTLNRIQIIEGKPTVLNDDGSATVYEVTEDELPNLLFDIETASSRGENVQLSTVPETELLSTKEDWDHEELVDLVDKVFHPRISSTMKLHDKPNPAVFGSPKNGMQVTGFFAPNGDGSGRYIHVNASKQRGGLHSVLDTISEEVAHFGFDTFLQNNKTFEKLYRNLYNIVLPEILVSDNMHHYIKKGGIDTDNPKAPEVYMLVNEYFSKLGVSFMDFTSSKVGLPLGMDRAAFNSIRSSVQNARVDDVIIDLTKDVDPSMQEEAMNLVRNVIRLQTSAVRGVGFNVQFQTERDDGTPGVLRIRSTPYGRASSFTPNTSQAKRIRKLKDLAHKRGEYSKNSTTIWNIRKFFQSLSFTNTPIGRERSISIADLVSNESKVRAEGLQGILRRRQSLNKVFVDFNIPPLNPGASYLDVMLEAGVPTDLRSGLLGQLTVLDVAKELDGVLKDGSRVKYENIAAIHNEFRKAKRQLIAWARGDETGVLAESLKEKIDNIENHQSRYTADWSHRRYDVDTRTGLKRLKIMLNDLESDIRGKDSTESAQESDRQYLGNLHDQAVQAGLQIESIENNPADAGVSANRELARLNEIVDLSERMTALYGYVVASAGTNNGRVDQETIQDAMRRKLSETIRRNEQKARIGTGKLNDVDADKSRDLDIEFNDADKLLAKFLGPLTDPSESMIFDLEQQGLILSSLGSANALAIDLVADTIARPEGLVTGDFTVDSRSKLLAQQQQGTLLEYIEVDSTFVNHIERSLKINGNTQFTALNNLIGEMKRNLTVRSLFGIASSYVGNISMMTSSGHIFTLDHYRTLPQNLKDAWQLRFNASFSGENGSNKIVDEMAHHNLLGSGVSTATVELSATNTIQKITDSLNTYIQSDRVQEIGDAVQRLDDNIAKVFSFSDDFPKMLPYVMNRELGVLEAELALPRDSFGNSDTEQTRYEDAIDDFASRFAAERTRRETVNWELSPQFLKEMASSNLRLFTPDFVGHMVQMVRTITENHIMIVEDVASARQHAALDNTELYAHYRNAAIKRSIGSGVNDAIWIGIGTGSYSIIADMMRGLYQQVDDEDDPNLPLKDRTNYSDEEWEAAKGMAKIYSEVTGMAYDAGPWRNGEKAVMMGYQRANASLSFAKPGSIDDYKIPATTFEAAEAIKSFMSNFLAIDNSTIINTLYRSWFLGRDKFGRPTTTSDKINDGMRLLTPQVIQQVNQIATGKRMFSQSKLNQMYALGTNFTGVKMREVSYPRLIYQYGQNLSRFKSASSSTHPKALTDKLNSGVSMTDKEVETLVASYQTITDGKFTEAQAAVGYMKGIGYSNTQVQKHLNTDPNGVSKNGLGKEDAELLLKNKNFFDAAMKRSLKGQLKRAKKENPTSDRLSEQELDNKRLNLERALGYYN